MKATIKLDVPEWQIGQPVTVYFKDTMMKTGTCEADNIVQCKDCKWNNGYIGCDKYLIPHGGDWFCAGGERR